MLVNLGAIMKKHTKENILKQYEKSGEIMYHTTLNGDYRKCNREGEKLQKIFKEFEKNSALADECIPELLKNPNVVVRTEAAAYCLALRRDIRLAEKILKDIASDPNSKIFGLNAEMTLKVWKEQGYL